MATRNGHSLQRSFLQRRAPEFARPACRPATTLRRVSSVEAIDPSAAAAYYQLSVPLSGSIRAEHAWLLLSGGRSRHGLRQCKRLGDFPRAFADESACEIFFEKRGWNLEEVEYLFATRCAAQLITCAVRFTGLPSASFGDISSGIDRSAGTTGQRIEALAVLKRSCGSCPQSASAHDRLARLHYQAGNLETAANILVLGIRGDSKNFLPLIRKAVIEQKLGRPDDSLHQSSELCNLPTASARLITILGGRLALFRETAGGRELFPGVSSRRFGEPTALCVGRRAFLAR